MVTAEDYALILGLPGTGKTSTIARAAMALLAAGRSVLVSSYTNSAVDNILLKLAGLGAPLLRLGRLEGIHPAMRPFALGGAHYPDTSASSLQRIARDARLVLFHTLLHDIHGRPTQHKVVEMRTLKAMLAVDCECTSAPSHLQLPSGHECGRSSTFPKANCSRSMSPDLHKMSDYQQLD